MTIRVKIGGKLYVLDGAEALPIAGRPRVWSSTGSEKLAADVQQAMRERFNINVPYSKQQRRLLFNGRTHFGRREN